MVAPFLELPPMPVSWLYRVVFQPAEIMQATSGVAILHKGAPGNNMESGHAVALSAQDAHD